SDHAIRGSSQQECLVIFVNELKVADLGALWVSIRETVQAILVFPIPDADSISIIRNSKMILKLMKGHLRRLTLIIEKTTRICPFAAACDFFLGLRFA